MSNFIRLKLNLLVKRNPIIFILFTPTKIVFYSVCKLNCIFDDIKKCALCNKEIIQVKFNYNFISVSLKWSIVSINMFLDHFYDECVQKKAGQSQDNGTKCMIMQDKVLKQLYV